MKKIIKKYLPDILILCGVWLFAYIKYFPIQSGLLSLVNKYEGYEGIGHDYSNYFKFLGIILLTIGINIAIRKIISLRK